jgi:membrane-bound inhibitor of C-type lysozyme
LKQVLIFALMLAVVTGASATEATDCAANDGAFLTGTVTVAPKFAAASSTISGIKLSHTKLSMLADQDGLTYEVAIDNVFAVDYVKNATTMPASLAAIKVGNRVEACGAKYTSGVGIHWVHTNCGDTPTTSAPNGWLKLFTSTTAVGANLERSETYCYLWD